MRDLTWLGSICAIAMIAAPASAQNAGPSFDCRKATLPDERAICGDNTLSRIDLVVARAYRQFMATAEPKQKYLPKLLLNERSGCGADIACIASLQLDSLLVFGAQTPAWASSYRDNAVLEKAYQVSIGARRGANMPLPTQLGQCAMSVISHIGTRLGDEDLASADPDVGSSVAFANQGYQVSYDHDVALANSQVGDPVAICLISIPRDCPPGDDRGRNYLTVNERTQATWSLPDAQHMCGGA